MENNPEKVFDATKEFEFEATKEFIDDNNLQGEVSVGEILIAELLGENEVQLPSGVIVTFKKFTAKDVLGMRKVMKGDDEDEIVYAMINAMCLFDGQKPFVEDLPDMDGFDFIALQDAINSRGGFTPNPAK